MQLISELRAEAREKLDGKWSTFVLMVFLLVIIEILLSVPSLIGDLYTKLNPEDDTITVIDYIDIFTHFPLYIPVHLGDCATWILDLIILYPLYWGLAVSFLHNHREEKVDIENLFDGFRGGRYFRTFGAMFLVEIFTLLWSLLLIVPGIMKSFSYALTPYIILDKPELSVNEAINLSCKIMKGRRLKLFCLYLSFIGWGILSILTFFIGLLWLLPYMEAATAAFYEDACAEYKANPTFEY